jgi:segregation and condensation protein B
LEVAGVGSTPEGAQRPEWLFVFTSYSAQRLIPLALLAPALGERRLPRFAQRYGDIPQARDGADQLALFHRIFKNEGMELYRILESLLFATDRPLTAKALAQKVQEAARVAPGLETEPHAKVAAAEIDAALAQLRESYDTSGSSLVVAEVAGGFVLKTRPEFAAWTNRLFDAPKAPKLSQPALETLAVIAYRQPIGRAEIEAVRGVAVDGVVATLLERKVIRIAGRSDLPGRPLLYETTPLFLELFGLKALDELPNADELRRLQPETPAHAPEQLEASLVAPDAAPAEAGGPDRPEVAAAAPAAD